MDNLRKRAGTEGEASRHGAATGGHGVVREGGKLARPGLHVSVFLDGPSEPEVGRTGGRDEVDRGIVFFAPVEGHAVGVRVFAFGVIISPAVGAGGDAIIS